MKRLYTYVNPKTGENASLLSKDVYGIINKNAALLDSSIIYDRDFSYDYFGFKTLEKSYLLKLDGKVVERPQHMLIWLTSPCAFFNCTAFSFGITMSCVYTNR